MKINLAFDEKSNAYVGSLDLPEIAPLAPVAPAAPAAPAAVEGMPSASGMLGPLVNLQVLDLPIGKAAVGAVGGLLVDRIVGRYLGNYGLIGNLGAAFAVKKFGSRFIGAPAADAIAFVLLYEAIVDKAEELVDKVLPAKANVQQLADSVVRQAQAQQSPSGYRGVL